LKIKIAPFSTPSFKQGWGKKKENDGAIFFCYKNCLVEDNKQGHYGFNYSHVNCNAMSEGGALSVFTPK
jgi:hypothetical protein